MEAQSYIYVSFSQLLGMQQYVPLLYADRLHYKVKNVLGGNKPSAIRGRGMDFEEVRKYVPGDDIRHIDWKVTARTKTTHAKVFTEEKEKPVLIVVDQSSSMFFGSQYKTKSVIAAELAALWAFKAHKQADRVGFLVLGNESAKLLRPKRALNHVMEGLRTITEFNTNLSNQQVNYEAKNVHHALEQLYNVISHDYTVIVISDFIHYNQQVVQSIFRIKQHNNVLLFKVFDEFEKHVMPQNFVITDSIFQQVVRGAKKQVRDSFQLGFAEQLQQFETKMKQHGVPLYGFTCNTNVHEQLAKYTFSW
jgi:uncharacterized protein (DUF58 family)